MENKEDIYKRFEREKQDIKKRKKSIQEGIQVHSREGFSSQLLNLIQELI